MSYRLKVISIRNSKWPLAAILNFEKAGLKVTNPQKYGKLLNFPQKAPNLAKMVQIWPFRRGPIAKKYGIPFFYDKLSALAGLKKLYLEPWKSL